MFSVQKDLFRQILPNFAQKLAELSTQKWSNFALNGRISPEAAKNRPFWLKFKSAGFG
jgi:hypothetical protein